MIAFPTVPCISCVDSDSYEDSCPYFLIPMQYKPCALARFLFMQAFYEVLSDPTTGLLDCHSLLHYLSADSQSREGLCKALSVAVGSPVTSLNPDNVDPQVTILLEDFHKVHGNIPHNAVFQLQLFFTILQALTHGVHPDSEIERGLAMVHVCTCQDVYVIMLCLSSHVFSLICWSCLLVSVLRTPVRCLCPPSSPTQHHYTTSLQPTTTHYQYAIILLTFDLFIVINSHRNFCCCSNHQVNKLRLNENCYIHETLLLI